MVGYSLVYMSRWCTTYLILYCNGNLQCVSNKLSDVSCGGFVYIPSCPMLGVLFWYIVGSRPNALSTISSIEQQYEKNMRPICASSHTKQPWAIVQLLPTLFFPKHQMKGIDNEKKHQSVHHHTLNSHGP